ncbi:DUF2306 domain-containing protein [Nonomuraea sp. SMC257]|uniref:DUF2306 domain-containing protein n=1 Tax=Nonomuraea montanisoli TaxID=2741721 RepID=A0A7Y6I692_9ACTN|nr:DUF2306 domain-containing protein [Nonomuraea montanisoli]NUW32467.1 DUF2306 domain-containing protein [Nonomuraea montanisoli]
MATTLTGSGPAPGEEGAEASPARRKAGPSRRRQLGWVVPLLIVMLGFVVYSLPPYLTFDPAQSRVDVSDSPAFFYPLLVAHIIFGTVALLTGCFQVWPWFRRSHPKAHRWMGRAYFFCGVFPAGITVLGVAPFGHTGFGGNTGNTMLGLVWLITGFAGWRMARQRRFPEHRRWMIRSFALTTSIVASRLWAGVLLAVQLPRLDSAYGGDQQAMIAAVGSAGVWLSWVVNLLLAEWWLEYTDHTGKPKSRGRSRARAASPAG